MSTWSKPSIVEIPAFRSPVGALGVIQGNEVFPFDIQRVYFLYDVPSDATRGSHAHKNLHQLIIAAAGSFTVRLDNGTSVEDFTLNRPNLGLTVPPGYWRTLTNFSAGSTALVLASQEYNEFDYIRDYDEFVEWTKQ